MQQVLLGLLGQHCLVYLDDVIVIGETQNKLLSNLPLVLQRYQHAGLTENPKKCVFLQGSLPFLEHIVSAEGLATDPEKVRTVTQWPAQTSGEETRSFLGLAGYYRAFSPSYGRIALPLTSLTEKTSEFKWAIEYEEAFQSLKTALTSAPILVFPDLSKNANPFILYTNASGHTIGVFLAQADQDGRERILQYGSRTLDKAERN